MDRSEFSQDDPHGLTDLDLGGQPPRVLENPAFGEQLQAEGSADPLAFRADTVPFVPYDFSEQRKHRRSRETIKQKRLRWNQRT